MYVYLSRSTYISISLHTCMYPSAPQTQHSLPLQSDLCGACVRGRLLVVTVKHLLVELSHWTSSLLIRHRPETLNGQRRHVSPCAAEWRLEEIREKDVSRHSPGHIPAECSGASARVLSQKPKSLLTHGNKHSQEKKSGPNSGHIGRRQRRHGSTVWCSTVRLYCFYCPASRK